MYSSPTATQPTTPDTDDVVFDPDASQYHTFRIPALLAIQPSSTADEPVLLAFCEGRIESTSDTGPIELVLRRSVDGGQTWQPLQVVCSANEKTCGNPVPILDPASGDVVLISVQNGARVGESAIKNGSAARAEARRVFVQRSSDLGRTWTEPSEITDQVHRPDWGWYATGPCHGIALQHGDHRGRLIVPANHSTIPTEAADEAGLQSGRKHDHLYGGHCIISDDGGHSWQIGFIADYEGTAINPNETAVAELADGRVIFNARNYHGSAGRRVQAISHDGGATLSGPYQACAVITTPDVQAGLVSPDGHRLLLSTPSRRDSRRELTIFVADNLDDWRRGAVINDGFSGYSDLALVDESRIGVLYEAGTDAANEEIRFTVRTTDELTSSSD